MTIIAWDGYSMAADKQSTVGNLKRTVTKIHRIDKLVVGVSGRSDHCNELIEWIRRGRLAHEFPACLRGDDGASALVIDTGRPLLYTGGPYPETIEDPVTAIGSGRDFAIAAMFLGQTAEVGVKVACMFDHGCGMGIDTIDVVERPAAAA